MRRATRKRLKVKPTGLCLAQLDAENLRIVRELAFLLTRLVPARRPAGLMAASAPGVRLANRSQGTRRAAWSVSRRDLMEREPLLLSSAASRASTPSRSADRRCAARWLRWLLSRPTQRAEASR